MAGALRTVKFAATPTAATQTYALAHLPVGRIRQIFSLFPWLTAVLFILPVLMGVTGTWLPAFGYLPDIGATAFTFSPWQQILDYPGTTSALRISLVTAWGAAVLSLLISCALLAYSWNSSGLRWLRRSLPALLGVPHAAFAIGMMALLAPAGWIMKLLSPWATGLESPALFSLVNDSHGFSLLLILTLKELPFVLFMSLAALSQMPVERTQHVCRSLGYSDAAAWWRVLIPQLLPRLRLPLFAVLAYGLSVVDMALIAGPNTPPSFAVLIDRLFNHPDITMRLPGSAGASLLLLLTGLSLLLWYLLERGGLRWIASRASAGRRGRLHPQLHQPFTQFMNLFASLLPAVTVAAFAVLMLWSFSFRWSFPDALPSSYSLQFWLRGWEQLREPLWLTLITGVAAALIGMVLVVACLEHEVTLRRRTGSEPRINLLWLIYVPLITPQISFLFGIQQGLLQINAWGNWLSLVWIHLVFVIPYLFLSLSGPYRSFDDRYLRQATSLSGSEWRALWQVKWPMLLKPLLYVAALGFAVSVSQYLATLYIGAGRLSTITTETVAIASGGDRRLIGVYSLFQWLLPLLIYSCALLIPYLCFRQRKGMQ